MTIVFMIFFEIKNIIFFTFLIHSVWFLYRIRLQPGRQDNHFTICVYHELLGGFLPEIECFRKYYAEIIYLSTEICNEFEK